MVIHSPHLLLSEGHPMPHMTLTSARYVRKYFFFKQRCAVKDQERLRKNKQQGFSNTKSSQLYPTLPLIPPAILNKLTPRYLNLPQIPDTVTVLPVSISDLGNLLISSSHLSFSAEKCYSRSDYCIWS